MNSHFTKECIQMTERERDSILLAIRVIKIKTTVRSQNTPIRRAKIKNKDTIICW